MFKEPLRYFPQRPCTLLAGPPLPPSERTYFMDDPKVIHNKETSKINKFFFTKFVYESLFCGILKKLPRCVFRTQTNM